MVCNCEDQIKNLSSSFIHNHKSLACKKHLEMPVLFTNHQSNVALIYFTKRSAIYSSTLYTGMRAWPRCWSSWAMRTMVSSGSCFMMVMNFSLFRWQRSQLASLGARVLTPVNRFRRALGDLLHMGFSENPGMSMSYSSAMESKR